MRLHPVLALAGATLPLAAAALGPGSASAAAVDPAVHATGVPAGQVQHGSWEETVRGAEPRDTITSFWVTDHRWRSETRDAASHHLVVESLYDGHRTTYRSPGRGRESFTQVHGADVPPLPGYPAAYARELIARKGAQPGALSTVAGIPAVTYALPDAPGTLSITVAQGTFAPLVRTSTAKGFSQTEAMLATTTDADPAAAAAVSPSRLRTLVQRWRRLAAPRP